MADFPSTVQRVLLMRHGHRFASGADPHLTRKGFFQAEQVAQMFSCSGLHIDAIYSSPFIRCLQTAAPLARALGMKIRVDRGFCEVLAHNWVFASNPLPHLSYEEMRSKRSALPEVQSDLIDMDYDSPVLQYPDFVGEAQPGLEEQRATPIARTKAALLRALATPWPRRGITVLVVCHGASHDYVTEALAPGSVRLDRQVPFCVDHVAITTLLRQPDGLFTLYGFNEKVPRLLASAWQRTFRWRLQPGEMPTAETWTVNELTWISGARRQDVRVLTPHALQSDDDLFLLDSLSGNVKVMNGDLVREAEPL